MDTSDDMGDSILDWFYRRNEPARLQDIDRALVAAQAIPIPPPVVAGRVAAHTDLRQPCIHFAAGNCRHRNCRFPHVIPVDAAPPPAIPPPPPPPHDDGQPPVREEPDMYEISQAIIFVNHENSPWYRKYVVWFHHSCNVVWMWLEGIVWLLFLALLAMCFFTDVWLLTVVGGYCVYRNFSGRMVLLYDHCVISHRVATSVTLYTPIGVTFSDPIYEDNTHVGNMAHYLGYKSQRRVCVYMRISQKMLVRAGGSLSGQVTMVANLIGYGMREYPEGDYGVMSNTALLVFQQVLANKDRARYALPTNVGSNATVSTTLP